MMPRTLVVLLLLVVCLVGCATSEPEFQVNRVFVAKQMNEVGMTDPPGQTAGNRIYSHGHVRHAGRTVRGAGRRFRIDASR